MKLSFAKQTNDLHDWQHKVRQKLLELTHYEEQLLQNWRLCETVDPVEAPPGVWRTRHVVQIGDLEPQAIYESAPSRRSFNGHTLIGLHGHGREPFAGIYEYLNELPRRGYRIFTPILFGTMERQVPNLGSECSNSVTEYCRAAQIQADLLGSTVLGLRIFDALLTYRFVLSRPQVDPQRIGTVGLSMGGELALYLAALEPGIARCVAAGFFTTFEDLLLKRFNCHCYSIRHWPRWFDMPDIAGAIAPRPLLLLRGRDDPYSGETAVDQAVSLLHSVYKAAGAANNLEFITYPGGHEMDIDRTDSWLKQS